MILANGPTGSGKTTTLYTILKQLNDPDVSIITIEDPIEYALEGTTQIQVNTETGTYVRERAAFHPAAGPEHHHGGGDPRRRNRVHCGERGPDRPPRALHAPHERFGDHLPAASGHGRAAVPGRFNREPCDRPAAWSVNCARNAKWKEHLHADELKSLREIIPEIDEKMHFYAAKGCEACDNTGYEGRLAVREVIEVKDKIREAHHEPRECAGDQGSGVLGRHEDHDAGCAHEGLGRAYHDRGSASRRS